MATDALASLRAALEMHGYSDVLADDLAPHLAAAIKSALKAAVPGRQQARNFDALVVTGIRAAARTLRRRGAR